VARRGKEAGCSTSGPTELILILTLALLLFGPKKLPEIGKTIGKGLSEFRQASSEIRREMSQAVKEQGSSGSPASNGGPAGGSGAAEASTGAASPGPLAPHPPGPTPGPKDAGTPSQ
jgi:sec-independent protein translocase protein TatA